MWVFSNTLRTPNSKYCTRIVGDSVLRFKVCVCVCCLGVVHAPVQFMCRMLPPFCMHWSSQWSRDKMRRWLIDYILWEMPPIMFHILYANVLFYPYLSFTSTTTWILPTVALTWKKHIIIKEGGWQGGLQWRWWTTCQQHHWAIVYNNWFSQWAAHQRSS